MPLEPGTRFGDYDILGPLGSGGMGEVYRAIDRGLGRQVAIKIVSGAHAAGPERLSRFDREARLLASLNHPGIASIYGRTESASGVVGLVLELVEGPTLAERLRRPLAYQEARAIALDLIDAISAAHDSGIIHRDLKPANIKFAADGSLKVLDFGLAKVMDRQPSDPGVSQDPTITNERTVPGTVLGTAAYMSPEQARGQEVDRGADVWAFGCIFYEMLTGQRAFAGDTPSDVIAAIINTEPDFTKLPPDVPEPARALLRRCLIKDSKRRLRDIADARFDLEGGEQRPQAPSRPGTVAWIAAALLALALAGIAAATLRPSAPSGSEAERISFVIPQPQGMQWSGAPVDPRPVPSPDGRYIAYTGRTDEGWRVWVHNLENGRATALVGAAPQGSITWAADSGNLAFCADRKIVRVSLTGAAPAPIDVDDCSWGVSWSRDGQFLFASPTKLSRVSVDGGSPQSVPIDNPAKGPFVYPQWLPDSRHFVYLARDPQAAVRGIYLGSIDGGQSVRLMPDDAAPRFVEGPDGRGRIVFVRGATLVSQALDRAGRRVEGEPVVLAENVSLGQTVRDGAYGVSPTLLVHRGGNTARMELVIMDRIGRRLSVLEPDAALVQVALSNDEARLAVTRTNQTQFAFEIWEYDLTRGGGRPLIAKPYSVTTPVWSPDGRIAYLSNEPGFWRPVILPASGKSVALPGAYSFLTEWSSDNRWILGTASDNGHLTAFHPDGNGETVSIADAAEGRLSPDLKSIAYRSSESGRAEVYIRGFPAAGRVVRVSREGGYKPWWRADGRELFFRTANGTMMAAPIGAGGQPGDPVPLFTAPFVAGSTLLPMHDYVVTRDGQRFIAVLAKDSPVTPLTVVVNWLK
jgi:Tol biopolymer transport system component